MLKRQTALMALLLTSQTACKKNRLPPPDPDSGVHQQDVTKVIRAARPEMEKCFDDAAAKRPDLVGKVVLVFAVRTDGTVDPASLGLGGQAGDPTFAQCVLDILAKQKFPPPKTTTDVQMPIDLSKHRDAGGAGSASK